MPRSPSIVPEDTAKDAADTSDGKNRIATIIGDLIGSAAGSRNQRIDG
jgi:hypothetical protein